ncbi:hypothetical protein EYR36_002992 [Pleurotus pulmonarius]|nr:hypothetical protein EYR36_002992 [Pleurotus pulmonarius]
MFKFNFDVEGANMHPTILDPPPEPSSNPSSSAAGTMQTFRELTLNELLDALPDMISYSPLSIPLSSGRDLTLVRRDLFDARFQLISEAEEDPDEETSKREKFSESSLKFVDSPSDLVPGVYEGGLKTWECALDLVDYLENDGARRPTGKVILELGCGTAIPSIYLLERLFAQPPTNTGLPMTHIHLQDYNDAVLQLVTLPNILLNWYMSPASASFRESITSSEVSFPPVDSTAPDELPITSELVAAFQDSLLAFKISLRFFAGSWETFDLQQSLSLTKQEGELYFIVLHIVNSSIASCFVANGDRTYDMVLTSETIYRVESLSALIELMKKAVSQHEYQCLVAAKVLYFGVGGGVSEFVARVEGQSGRVETVWEKSAGVGRKIMQVLRLFDLELRLLFYMPPSPLELWSSSAKGHIRSDLDPANHFFRNIDIPFEDFITALVSISKDDISSIESRPWDMLDDLVSNYGRMVQQKIHESKLYPFFQRILVRLAQELRKDEDLAFVARTVHTSGLKNQYSSRRPDGSIWWNTGDHAWHLMKATIEMKRRHGYNHREFGYFCHTMPDTVYDTEVPARGSKTARSAPRIPTIPEMPQLPGSPSTQPSNATADLPPVPSVASPEEATATFSESRVTTVVPSGPLSKKRPRERAEIVLPRDIAKPSKQDPRFIITAPPLYVYRGVVGRGSIVYPVMALSGVFQNRELVAKWSWPLAVRKREHELIDRLRRLVPFMQQHLPEVLEHREYSMEELGLPSEELNILPDPNQPQRLPTNSLLQPWEGDNYQYNALTKTGIDQLPEYRRKLLGAVQPAFKPLVDKWLVPLLRLFSNARHYLAWSAQDADFDAETLGGILTFEKFMGTIGVVPREVQ